MTDYYCDLSLDYEDIDIDNPSDSPSDLPGAFVYTGPGGFQAAIRGTGKANAMAAGDTLYLKGTADLSKLVQIVCDNNIGVGGQEWLVGDTVADNGGGTTWIGTICEMEVGAVNTTLLTQLTTGDFSVVFGDFANGIQNVSQTETDTIAAEGQITCPGIQLADVNGDTTDGSIKFIGVNVDWVQDFTTQAILDGNSQATNCVSAANDVDYYTMENITFTRAVSDGLEMGIAFTSSYLILRRCIAILNTDYGLDLFQTANPIIIECILENNTGFGIRVGPDAKIIFSRIEGNSNGIYIFSGGNNVIYGNLVIDNGLEGVFVRNPSDGNSIINNVINMVGGQNGIMQNIPSNGELVLCNRITNVPATYYGINWGASGVYDAFIEDWNVFYNPLAESDLASVTSGRNSYGIETNHLTNPDGDDGYDGETWNVADGKAHDSTEINLYWDS